MGGRVSSRGRHASAAPSTRLDSPSADKIKVVVLGEAAAGKTTLFRRWVGTPLDADYVPSTTVSVGVKLLRLEGHDPVVVELWDVPSQSYAGPSIFSRYLRGAQAIVLVFSLQAPSSWKALPKYLDVARQEISAEAPSSKPVPVVVVGNKSDNVGQDAQDERDSVRLWCHEHGINYVEVSALVGDSAVLNVLIKLLNSNNL